MPNWCYQSLHLIGSGALLKELNLSLNNNRFCDFVRPMPCKVWLEPDEEGQGWYNWRLNNWGTKWDVSSVEDQVFNYADNKSTLAFKCQTPWNVPLFIWDELVLMGIQVDADYHEESGLFRGEYRNGVNYKYKDGELV